MKQGVDDLVILSGMSGSGKSSALNTLEDAGYFTIDNLPGPLLPHLLQHLPRPSGPGPRKIALVMDAREKDFLGHFESYFKLLKNQQIRHRVVFLDARDEILLRRFSETRRKHPLAPDKTVRVGIQKERRLLGPVRAVSTQIIDTSEMNVHQFREKVLSLLRKDRRENRPSVSLVSFGYRYGLPLEADVVLDVRFLPNPHFVPKLKPLSGRDNAVARFVLRQAITRSFLTPLRKILDLLLRQSEKEGKAYLTIAFGCTGGRHRSVVLAEKISNHLKRLGYPVKILHRDIGRGG